MVASASKLLPKTVNGIVPAMLNSLRS